MKKKSMLILAILLMSIGFASISTTLIINGNAKVSENQDDFSVIFTAADIDGVNVYNKVISADKKTITFETGELKTLNQTSTLNYEITNNSSQYDAEVNITCVASSESSVKYTSATNMLEGNSSKVLARNSLKGTLTITLEKLPIEEVTEKYICNLEIAAIERTETGVEIIPDPISFASDSWKTIQKAVQTGNTSKYNIGDTKSVNLEELGTHTVRISNMSECTNGETSETACGFVVEFADIITEQQFNSTNTNAGGWRDSELRTYVNETIYNALPSDLQSAITLTKVISSHGSSVGETNMETKDKIYLLNCEEIWTKNDYDTSIATSRQLDYYKELGVTADNYSSAIKQYNGINTWWWLRSAHRNYSNDFLSVLDYGRWGNFVSQRFGGISPAFRIG